MHKKGLKLEPVVELAKLKSTYITVVKQPKLGLGMMKFLKKIMKTLKTEIF